MTDENEVSADARLAELAAELRARSATYAFLARALSDDELPASFLSALAADAPETGTELDGFARGLRGLDAEGLEGRRRELAADHAAVLLGMSARPVSPYESVHTSPEGLTMQGARDAAVAAYAAAGFAKAAELHLPEDHVALELDFAGALLARAAEALEQPGDAQALARAECDVNAQADFVRARLAPWVPGFADKLEARSSTPFYRGVAQMLRAFVADEVAWLDEAEGASA